MKLDATDLRYISSDEFRVLTAVEMGSKNHEVVPSVLIAQISGLKHSGINKLMGSLAKRNLIARVQNARYDGYRLTYGGYDYLAMRAFAKRDSVYSVGNQIGVGKESDIYVVADAEGNQRVLKLHRLGRVSFRDVKSKRDYMGKRRSASWMYMSRLAAAKEYAFMQILHAHGFPVPQPFDQARHCIVMSLIDAFPLRQIAALPPNQVSALYAALMALIVRLARAGLIHGDFNEFNLLIREVPNAEKEEGECEGGCEKGKGKARAKEVATTAEEESGDFNTVERKVLQPVAESVSVPAANAETATEADEEDGEDEEASERIHLEDGSTVEPVLIDFPQMVSVDHVNAEYYFDRDVECVRRFFRKRFRFVSEEFPKFRDAVPIDRAERRARRAAEKGAGAGANAKGEGAEEEEAQGGLRQLTEEDGLGEELDLDIKAEASGFGTKSQRQKQLEEYMASVQLAETEGADVGSGSGEDEEEDDDGEEEEEEAAGEEQEQEQEEEEGEKEEEEDNEEEEEDEEVSGSEPRSKSKPKSKSKSKPSVPKAIEEADNVDIDIAARVASDRLRSERRQTKHHGRKAHAGAVGRQTGSKAKTDKRRLVKDSLTF